MVLSLFADPLSVCLTTPYIKPNMLRGAQVGVSVKVRAGHE